MKYVCVCGWNLHTDGEPIRCGQCGRMFYPSGLGTRIRYSLGGFGRWYKRTFKQVTGKSCGCEKREQTLNRWTHQVRKWWSREG